ncbi:hypothetical protein ABK040_000115 [Willaertia magna]
MGRRDDDDNFVPPKLSEEEINKINEESAKIPFFNSAIKDEYIEPEIKGNKEKIDVNPEDVKLQNVVRQTITNPKTIQATSAQIGRATGIGYSLMGAGVVLGLGLGYLIKWRRRQQEVKH